MLLRVEIEKYLWRWRWPIAVVVVLLFLIAVQMLRVNRPIPSVAQPIVTYSTPGPLLSGNLTIPAQDSYFRQIDLNRRTTLSGVFRTPAIKSRVSVLVVDKANFEKWKVNLAFHSVTQTGYVPGGKISPVLQPGTYFLVIDNRSNERPESVYVNFNLE
jgi:hypothetical protein